MCRGAWLVARIVVVPDLFVDLMGLCIFTSFAACRLVGFVAHSADRRSTAVALGHRRCAAGPLAFVRPPCSIVARLAGWGRIAECLRTSRVRSRHGTRCPTIHPIARQTQTGTRRWPKDRQRWGRSAHVNRPGMKRVEEKSNQ